ncbi:hypothetical protein BDN71DRAFT_1456379 [Pleurotus eryngii]|uniref:Uncharacterized protein n=1 Tax=Pleurotus eryngii TaxID=5323 RepID=A0A9P5ZL42_PLEER|nr:hypothetical protein BDN71DRAFT_1456379 [Pleurotus eryngii]
MQTGAHNRYSTTLRQLSRLRNPLNVINTQTPAIAAPLHFVSPSMSSTEPNNLSPTPALRSPPTPNAASTHTRDAIVVPPSAAPSSQRHTHETT